MHQNAIKHRIQSYQRIKECNSCEACQTYERNRVETVETSQRTDAEKCGLLQDHREQLHVEVEDIEYYLTILLSTSVVGTGA